MEAGVVVVGHGVVRVGVVNSVVSVGVVVVNGVIIKVTAVVGGMGVRDLVNMVVEIEGAGVVVVGHGVVTAGVVNSVVRVVVVNGVVIKVAAVVDVANMVVEIESVTTIYNT